MWKCDTSSAFWVLEGGGLSQESKLFSPAFCKRTESERESYHSSLEAESARGSCEMNHHLRKFVPLPTVWFRSKDFRYFRKYRKCFIDNKNVPLASRRHISLAITGNEVPYSVSICCIQSKANTRSRICTIGSGDTEKWDLCHANLLDKHVFVNLLDILKQTLSFKTPLDTPLRKAFSAPNKFADCVLTDWSSSLMSDVAP